MHSDCMSADFLLTLFGANLIEEITAAENKKCFHVYTERTA